MADGSKEELELEIARIRGIVDNLKRKREKLGSLEPTTDKGKDARAQAVTALTDQIKEYDGHLKVLVEEREIAEVNLILNGKQ